MRRLLLVLPFVLFACEQNDNSPPPTTPSSSYPAGSPMAHTEKILSYGPRPPASPALRKALNYISRTLKESGWVVGSQSFEAQTPFGPRTFTNLIARYPASPQQDVWKQPVRGILCAHIDSKFYPRKRFLGADDAASACGLILTLAADLANEQPDQAAALELVFFDGEEAFGNNINLRTGDGLYGSRQYAGRWRTSQQKPSFGILLDMVGHKNLSIKVPTDSPPFLVAAMDLAAEQTGHTEHFGMASGQILDDHFHLNAIGIPTIDLIGDFSRSNWWHTERDNLANLSSDSLEITRQVVRGMLDQLLTDS